MTDASRSSLMRCVLIASGALIAQAGALLAMGRVPICTCGTVRLWAGEVMSAENSQQIFDWYTFSHVIHGILFYALAWLLLPRTSLVTRFAAAVALEAGWEIVENTPFVIERYRAGTISLNYYGDSVINSLSDTVAMIIGFVIAYRFPISVVVGLAIAMEAALAYMIRDNLTLNVIMLLHPFEAIRAWQSAL